jgi:hypothetical protein
MIVLSPADEETIRLIPPGYKHSMLVAALTKRVLLTGKMTAADRLDFLEKLNSLVDGDFTTEMLELIEPMSDVECRMVAEAMTLDIDNKRSAASYDVLTREDVFHHFVRLNPSLLAAIKFRETRSQRPAQAMQKGEMAGGMT